MESDSKNIQIFCNIFHKKESYEKLMKGMSGNYEAIIKRIKELLNEKPVNNKTENLSSAKMFLNIKENKEAFQNFFQQSKQGVFQEY